ncbi:PH domain-containing protein [Durusdinium trenchii]|uniref:PH domain-containing protein n=1 Tax=Durusdinium trenchii TaxID=1381693 RepID=A0ABP0KBT8_9DINO
MPFGSQGRFEFPSLAPELNQLFLHEALLRAAAQLLGTQDIRLTQADAWFKEGAAEEPGAARSPFASVEQRMHMDFPNHALVHPSDWDDPETVAIIIYLSDASACDGRTGVVPRRGPGDPLYVWPYIKMPGVGLLPWVNDRAQAEASVAERDAEAADFRAQLYAREELVNYSVGSVLLYRHDIWHRGRPVRPGASRLVCNLVFKRAGRDQINHWNTGFARFFYNIKAVLAAPAAEARWGALGLDLAPYRAAFALANSEQAQQWRRELRDLQARLDDLRPAL